MPEKILTRRISDLLMDDEVPMKRGKSINGSMVDKLLKALPEFSEKESHNYIYVEYNRQQYLLFV